MDPVKDSARSIAREVNAGAVSAAEVAERLIPHVAQADTRLRAYLQLTPDLMRAHARRVDERVAAGERLPLAGVPVALKDNMCLTRHADDRGLEDPGELHRAVHRDGRAAAARRGRAADRQDEPRRVRDGLVGRELGVPRDAQSRTTSTACPAARRPAARRRSAGSPRRSRSAATPAAPSASRPRSATSSASSRRTAACRATG